MMREEFYQSQFGDPEPQNQEEEDEEVEEEEEADIGQVAALPIHTNAGESFL